MLLLRLPASLLLRLDESVLDASLLFQDAPRNTRRCASGRLFLQVCLRLPARLSLQNLALSSSQKKFTRYAGTVKWKRVKA